MVSARVSFGTLMVGFFFMAGALVRLGYALLYPSKRWSLRNRWRARTGLSDKTIWDWLQLLIVPLVLAAIGILFTAQQDIRQQAVEAQRAQDTALQAYLDQMGRLLFENNLRGAEEGSEIRTLARARTLTVLGSLDPDRKTQVMQFLLEANLIRSIEGRAPVIGLGNADLSGANLRGANLNGSQLAGAELSDANLTGARLGGANMRYTNLSDADLSGADLAATDLRNASLFNVELRGADLSGAEGISKELLEDMTTYLKGATMPDGSKYP
jgi:uncharacterized protein YjbI with pentapeptide repeats